MKYILLLHHDEEAFSKFRETERRQMSEGSIRLTHQLHAKGQYLDAAPLHPTSLATSVRVRNGKRLVTDGPLHGDARAARRYFLIDVRDLDEAIEVAARIPGASIGTAEIRPVKEVAGLPWD